MRAIICIFLIFVCCIFTASALDDYDYYQSISYSACDQEIYQQDIVIHRTTGDPYEESFGGLNIWHLYVGDRCQADYDDITFTNSDGEEYSYYRFPDYDSNVGKFCVIMTNTTTSDDLMMYYGNPDKITSSLLDAPYFIDDCESGAGWTLTGSEGWSTGYGHSGYGYGNPAKSTGSAYRTISLTGEGEHLKVWGYRTYSKYGGSTYGRIKLDSTVIKNFPRDGSWHYYDVDLSSWSAGTHTLTFEGHWDGIGDHYSGDCVFDDVLIRIFATLPPSATVFSGEQDHRLVARYPEQLLYPTDPDFDGLYEDVNGNSRLDFQDIMIFFQYNAWAQANQPNVSCFDWSGNGAIEFSDVQAFWEAEFT